MAGSLPHALYTAEQVRRLDAEAIGNHRIPGIELMKRAGQATFDILFNTWLQSGRNKSVQVFCGGGNNGGDGYIIAALALQRYIPVKVISLCPPDRLTGDARKACDWFRELGGRCRPWSDAIKVSDGVLVDAMLGTGLSGPVKGGYVDAIALLNRSVNPVLAVDLPSGLCADTGAELGCAVQANITVSFIGMKQGLLTGAGPRCCGELRFSGLGVPEAIYSTERSSARLLHHRQMTALGRPRHKDAHKGDYGHLLVVGGDHGMGGAAVMAAETALRCGTGLVTLATRPEHVLPSLVRRPEVMARGIDNPVGLALLLEGKTAIAIGPGLGQDSWGLEMLRIVLESGLPVVLDADALNLLAMSPELIKPGPHMVLTPHPGEAGRLLGLSTGEVSGDRFSAVRALQTLCGGAAVLKGAGSLVCSDSGVDICSKGNPGMAVAGMGDVLTGVVGSLLAQGHSARDAARMGVWVHACAGDDCAAESGEYGMAATDLIPAIRRLVNLINGE